MEILIPDRIKQFAARAVREELYPYRAGTPRDPAYDVLPEPVMIAMNIRDYLRTTSIYDTEGQLLPGCVRIEGLQVPGCAYRHTAHNGYNSFFHIHSDYMPSSNVAFCDWNHFCNDYRFILKHGFKGRLETIREAKEKFAGNREKLDFLEACEIIVDSVHDLSARFGCEVPYEPAKSFDDALKSVWISFLLMPDSIGRLDDLLWPYYKHDLDAGIITREHAVEMIGEFLVKIFAHVGPGSHKSGDNTFVIGGYVPADERETGETRRLSRNEAPRRLHRAIGDHPPHPRRPADMASADQLPLDKADKAGNDEARDRNEREMRRHRFRERRNIPPRL